MSDSSPKSQQEATEPTAASAAVPEGSFRRYLFYPAVIVILIVSFFVMFGGLPGIGPVESTSEKVLLGGDYYVRVSLVEVVAKSPSGKLWDHYNSTAPDLYVTIEWKGQQVFRSSTKEDSLLGKWSQAELDLTEVAFTGGTTSEDDLMKAARINIAKDDTLSIRVYDKDIIGSDELIAEFELKSEDLREGSWLLEQPVDNIKRLKLSAYPIESD